jgi:hypothetical protein
MGQPLARSGPLSHGALSLNGALSLSGHGRLLPFQKSNWPATEFGCPMDRGAGKAGMREFDVEQ